MKIRKISSSAVLNPKAVEGYKDLLKNFFGSERGNKVIEDLIIELRKKGDPNVYNAEEALKKLEREDQELKERQRIEREQYWEQRKKERAEREQRYIGYGKELDDYWRQNSLDSFVTDQGIAYQDAIDIYKGFLKTLFPDFIEEVYEDYYNEDDKQVYISKDSKYAWQGIAPFMNKSHLSKEEVQQDIISDMDENIRNSENFDLYISNKENDNGRYLTKREFEERQMVERKRDEEALRAREDSLYNQFEEYKKKKGLDPDLDYYEWESQYESIPDEEAWDPELLESYKNWRRDNPFAGSYERKSFFDTWYKNSDYFYEDEEQQEEWWNNKRRRHQEQNQNEQNSSRAKAKQSSEWKTIDDLLQFAENHGVKLPTIDKGDFKAACKKIYRSLAHHFHPDKYPDAKKKKWAEDEFKKLQRLWSDFAKVHKLASTKNWYRFATD